MANQIPVLTGYSLSSRDLLLKLTLDHFAKLSKDQNFESDSSRYLATSITAVAYLKETRQYRKQLQLCLKNFAGRTAESFRPEYISAVRKLYQDHLINLGRAVIAFADQNIQQKKTLDIDFTGTTITNQHFSGILESLFNEYGQDHLQMDYQPWTCRKARIHESSKDTINRLEGKLRTIGQFGCLEDAISFLEIRIGLHGKYTYKLLVDDLDELITDFLIDSTNGQINRIKARKPVDELVREAAGKYEILNAPNYLINPEAYKSILRHRIKSVIKKS